MQLPENVRLFVCADGEDDLEITGDISLELIVATLKAAEYVSREPGGASGTEQLGILELFGDHPKPTDYYICFAGEIPEDLKRQINGKTWPWIFDEDTNEWNPSLFLRLDQVDWGDDSVGTRVHGILVNGPISHRRDVPIFSRGKPIEAVAQLWDALTIPGLLKTKNLGRGSHDRIQEVMRALCLPPISDRGLPENFPWDRLGL